MDWENSPSSRLSPDVGNALLLVYLWLRTSTSLFGEELWSLRLLTPSPLFDLCRGPVTDDDAFVDRLKSLLLSQQRHLGDFALEYAKALKALYDQPKLHSAAGDLFSACKSAPDKTVKKAIELFFKYAQLMRCIQYLPYVCVFYSMNHAAGVAALEWFWNRKRQTLTRFDVQ